MSDCDTCGRPGSCCSRFNLNGVSDAADDNAVDNRLSFLGLPFVRAGWSNGRRLFSCPKISAEGRCTIYDARPAACRDYQPGSDPLCTHHPQWTLPEDR